MFPLNRKSIVLACIVLLFLLTGCVTMEVEQKLYKDGTFDLTVTITSDNPEMVDFFSSSLTGMENATVTELEDGLRYEMKDLSLDREADDNSTFAERWGIEKEFKFPHQYITFTYDNRGIGSERTSQMPGMTPDIDYVFEPFGKITDTNGIRIEGENKVKFNLMKNKKYYVTFRYFCLFPFLCGEDNIPERKPLNKTPEIVSGGEDMFKGMGPTDNMTGSSSTQSDEDYGPVTHLDISCGFRDNWDADAEDDGIEIMIAPSDNKDNIVPLEGTVEVKAYEKIPVSGMEYVEGDMVSNQTFDLTGEERMEHFSEWKGYTLRFSWEKVREFPSESSDSGILFATFTDTEGDTFEAKTGEGMIGQCPLR